MARKFQFDDEIEKINKAIVNACRNTYLNENENYSAKIIKEYKKKNCFTKPAGYNANETKKLLNS